MPTADVAESMEQVSAGSERRDGCAAVAHTVGRRRSDLRSIDGIETLPSLRTVDLSSNDLTSVRGLAHCKALEEVNLADNDLSDLPSVLALASCPRLRTLNLTGHKFSKDQVRKIREQFAKHLPGCNVILGEGGGGGKCAIM